MIGEAHPAAPHDRTEYRLRPHRVRHRDVEASGLEDPVGPAAGRDDPIWKTAIHAPVDAAIALVALLLLARWRVPPIIVVLLSATLSLMAALA